MPLRSHVPQQRYPRIEPNDRLSNPLDEMARVLDRPPPVASEASPDDVRLTPRWIHGELHDELHAMEGHVVMTFYGPSQDVSWREGADRRYSRTRPGAITLIPAGHEGKWDINGPIEVSHVYLSDERLKLVAQGLGGGKPFELIQRILFDDPVAANILQMLGGEAAARDAPSRLFVDQAIDLLCTHLVRGHSSMGALDSTPRRGLADWQVKKVTGYMREHFCRDIGIQELADLVGLSRFHFASAFRLATGHSPHAWLTDLRMQHARQLLSQSELPVTGIALAVGFQTPSSFAAAFRKRLGMTPSQFRRAL